MSSAKDSLEDKKARLAQLRKEAEEKRNRANKALGASFIGSKTQGGKADDINELMNKVVSSSTFEERKKKEEVEKNPATPKTINTSLTVALDQ